MEPINAVGASKPRSRAVAVICQAAVGCFSSFNMAGGGATQKQADEKALALFRPLLNTLGFLRFERKNQPQLGETTNRCLQMRLRIDVPFEYQNGVQQFWRHSNRCNESQPAPGAKPPASRSGSANLEAGLADERKAYGVVVFVLGPNLHNGLLDPQPAFWVHA